MDLERDNVKELETLSKYRELNTEANMDLIEEDTPDTIDTNKVCGLYLIGEPDTIIEINMKYYDINCETGALMAVSSIKNVNRKFSNFVRCFSLLMVGN